MERKITIITERKIFRNINEELQWFANSLGLFNLRDKDKSCFRIFLELLKASKLNLGLKSEDLAKKLKLSRATVVHHLDKLMKAGIVINEKNYYVLRTNSLEELVDEIRNDVENCFKTLREVAKEIDEKLRVVK